MAEMEFKVELESLNWLGMDHTTNWVLDVLVANEEYQKVRKDENEEKSSSTSEASDITAEEMINSAFGRASNTVKNILKGKGAVTNESSQISL